VVSRELNVRQVLTKVALGEAEAGIVYRTDVTGAVKALPIPSQVNVTAEYPIAVTTGAPHAAFAKAWVELVLSDAGKRRLAEAGFLPSP
jgi:molybdate transport system substrate-binding protein